MPPRCARPCSPSSAAVCPGRLLCRRHRAADLLRSLRFLPGSFVGNPSLKPESSRGFEASLRYRGERSVEASLTGYRQRLHDEIVADRPTSPARSTATAPASARAWRPKLGWSLGEQLRLSGQLRLSPCDRAETVGRSSDPRDPSPEAQRVDRPRRRSRPTSAMAPRSLTPERIWTIISTSSLRRSSVSTPTGSPSARSSYRAAPKSRAVRARLQPVRFALPGRVRLSHRREGALCRHSPRFWPLAPRCGSPRSTCAPTNICCCSPSRGRSSGVSYLARDPREIVRCGAGAALSRQSRVDRGHPAAPPQPRS